MKIEVCRYHLVNGLKFQPIDFAIVTSKLIANNVPPQGRGVGVRWIIPYRGTINVHIPLFIVLSLCDVGEELYANDCGVAEDLCCAVRDGSAGRDRIKNRRVGSWFPSSEDLEQGTRHPFASP